MAATCAACLQPIYDGDPFVLSGTEVFHRTKTCVAKISRSLTTRLRLELAKVKAAGERDRAEAATSKIEMQDAQNRLDSAQRELTCQKARALEEQHRCQRVELEKSHLFQDLAAMTAQRGQFRTDLVAAQNEIARLQADAIRRAKDDLPVAPESDSRDATEIRFSLLELDKT